MPLFPSTPRLLAFFAAFLLIPPVAASDRASRRYREGRSAEALQLYRAEMKGSPDFSVVLDAAHVAQELGHQREAITWLKKAASRESPDPAILTELGWGYLNEGQFDQASFWLTSATRADPSSVRARLGAGVVALETGRLEEADALFTELVTEDPRLSLAYFYLGLTSERRGRLDEALAQWRQAIKEDSHFVEVRLRLGAALEKAGRYDEAWSEYARVNYADPRNRQAQAGVARLARRITRKPEEILPPRRIESPTPLPAAPPEKRWIRIGIGTSGGGSPTPKKRIHFRASHPFQIVDSDGRSLAAGVPEDTWEIRLVSAKRPFGQIVDSSGVTRGQFTGTAVIRSSSAEGTIILNTLRFAPGMAWGGMADREFRGDMEVTVSGRRKRLILVNRVGLEQYVYGVLAAEMPVHWPLEALKCQAIIARTLAVFRGQRLRLHRRYGYDLCDGQHCQVYTGVAAESDRARRATDETRNLIVMYEGRPAHTVFSSNCGGSAQSGPQAGWGIVPYWQPVTDTRPGTVFPKTPYALRVWLGGRPAIYCASSSFVWHPEYRWSRVVPAQTIGDRLARKRRIGRVRQIYIRRRNSTGRVQTVEVVGTQGRITLSREHEIRRYLGLGLLRSTQFVMETVVRDGKAKEFLFSGGGWGHGVGLCQSGAAGRAEAGGFAKEILAHYYPGTSLESLP